MPKTHTCKAESILPVTCCFVLVEHDIEHASKLHPEQVLEVALYEMIGGSCAMSLAAPLEACSGTDQLLSFRASHTISLRYESKDQRCCLLSSLQIPLPPVTKQTSRKRNPCRDCSVTERLHELQVRCADEVRRAGQMGHLESDSEGGGTVFVHF